MAGVWGTSLSGQDQGVVTSQMPRQTGGRSGSGDPGRVGGDPWRGTVTSGQEIEPALVATQQGGSVKIYSHSLLSLLCLLGSQGASHP